MKKQAFFKGVYIMLAALCIGLMGCSNPVKDELLTYINKDLSKLGNMEDTAIKAFESVTGENYTDDTRLYNALTETVIPSYAELTTELEALSAKLKTAEVRKLHEKYIEGANLQNSAFVTFKVALEEGDSNKVLAANDKLTQGRKMIREFTAELKDLCDKNGIQLKK